MEYSISVSEILVAILTIIAAGLGFIIREQREKIKTIQNQLSDKKYKVYHELYSVFFDMLKQQKNLQVEDGHLMAVRLVDIKKDLLIYAPDNIVSQFLLWNRSGGNAADDITHINLFLKLFILIRKDMGNSKTIINEMDILRSIMINDSEFETFKRLLKK